MDSTDKIKILLEDFAEKEALNREEIGEIEKQIKELEQLIQVSKDRMERVAADKEKVYKMRNRYAEGDWSDVLAKASEKIKSEKEAAAATENDTNGGGSSGVASAAAQESDDSKVGLETRDVPVVNVEAIEESQANEAAPADAPQPSQPPESVPIPVSPFGEPIAPEASSAPAPVPIPAPPEEASPPQTIPQPMPDTPAVENTVPPGLEHDVLPVALDNPEQPPILPGIPNPPTGFDAMQVPPGMPNLGMQPAQAPAEQPQESSLFPFNQGGEMPSDLDQDSPWSGMTWESSGNSDQVEENQSTQQPQPPQPVAQVPQQIQPLQQPQAPQTPPAPPQPVQPVQPQMQPPAAPNGFDQMPQPPQVQSPVPPQQQAVLMQSQMNMQEPEAVDPSQAGNHQAFDISDALKPEYDEEEDEPPKDDENVKKINDALRGLFS